MKSLVSLLLEVFSELLSYATFQKFSLSLLLVVLLNVVPFIGYFYFEWNPIVIFFIYWLESVIIGLYNLFKMVCVSFYLGLKNKSFSAFTGGLFFSGFFTVHFFGFCLVHLMFMPKPAKGDIVSLMDFDILYSIGIIIFSHGYSTIRYFFVEKEYRQYLKKPLTYQMLPPYGRVVTLHLTLFAGNWFDIFEGSESVVALMLLMSFKTITDLIAHYLEHRNLLKPPEFESDVNPAV